MWKKKCLEEFRVCGKYLVSSRPLLEAPLKTWRHLTLSTPNTPAPPLVSSSYSRQRHSSSCSGQSPWNHLWLLPFFHPKDSWLFLQNISRTRLPPPWPPLSPARLSKPPIWSVSVFEPIQSVLNAATKMMLLKCKWDHIIPLYSALVEWLPVSSGVKTKFPTNSPGGPKWPAISRPACLTSSPAPLLMYPL